MISLRARAILLTLGLLLQAIIVCWAQPNPENSKTLLENISEAGNKPRLMNLLQHAGLTPVLTSAGNYTFLVPSEAALTKLDNMPPEAVRTILSYHILEGIHKIEDLKDGSKLKTLQGGHVSVCRKKGRLLINGIPLSGSNSVSSNGIWLSLDGLLMVE